MSIYISRATQKLYVRRATHKKWSDGGELYDFSQEFPVTIKDPDKPIGTHIFTAVARDGGGLRWTEVSIDNGDNAKDALDRITFPQEVLDKIAPTAVPLSSIIISDEPLSSETNYRTEFVAVLNNQPQGGFITRAPSPKVNVARDDGGLFGHFGGWFGSSGYNQPPPPPPADSRPAACRIILIRDSDADGAIGERVHISTASALGDAINLLLYGAGVGVDVDWRHAAEFLLAIARRTAFGSALMTSIKVRAAPDGRRVPSSHLRTVPTAVPTKRANSRCDRPSLCRASRASVSLGTTRWTITSAFSPRAYFSASCQAGANIVGEARLRSALFHFFRHCVTASFAVACKFLLLARAQISLSRSWHRAP